MSEETQAVERDYYGNPIKDPFVIKQRRERREWLAGMTDEQKAAMAAGVETTRTEPVTKTGKALMETCIRDRRYVLLCYVENDF